MVVHADLIRSGSALGYWVERWNRFDFVVVIASWLEVIVRVFSLEDHMPPTPFRLLRVARVVGRIGRIFKLSKRLESLKIVFDTFTEALPPMGYVVLLIALVLYIFGVIGMNLFGKLQYQDCINDDTNFKTVPNVCTHSSHLLLGATACSLLTSLISIVDAQQ